MPGGRLHPGRARRTPARGQPVRGGAHGLRCGVPADRRDRHPLASSARYRRRPGQRRARKAWPPSIAIVCPVIHPDVPRRRTDPVGDVLGPGPAAASRCPRRSGPGPRCRSSPTASRGGVGQHEPGRDAVHRDAGPASSCGHLPGEPDLPGLGAGVGLDAGPADAPPGAGGDVHDPAPAAGASCPGRPPGCTGRCWSGCVHDGVPSSPRCYLLDRPCDLADDPAGVVHQDVDRPDPGEEARSRPAASVRSTVSLSTPCTVAPLPQGLGDRGPDPVRVPVTTAAFRWPHSLVRPSVFQKLTYLGNARVPYRPHVLIGALVGPALVLFGSSPPKSTIRSSRSRWSAICIQLLSKTRNGPHPRSDNSHAKMHHVSKSKFIGRGRRFICRRCPRKWIAQAISPDKYLLSLRIGVIFPSCPRVAVPLKPTLHLLCQPAGSTCRRNLRRFRSTMSTGKYSCCSARTPDAPSGRWPASSGCRPPRSGSGSAVWNASA